MADAEERLGKGSPMERCFAILDLMTLRQDAAWFQEPVPVGEDGIPDYCELDEYVLVPLDFPTIQSAVDGGSGRVILLEPGTFSEEGAVACLNCDVGFYSDDGAASCEKCRACGKGQFVAKVCIAQSNGVCQKCLSGQFATDASDSAKGGAL